MSKVTKIIAGLAGGIVIVATGAFLWWIEDGPEVVDLETAVAQIQSADRDDTQNSLATEASEDIGMASGSLPDAPVTAVNSETTGDVPTTDTGATSETVSSVGDGSQDASVANGNSSTAREAPETATSAETSSASEGTSQGNESTDEIGATPDSDSSVPLSNTMTTEDGPSNHPETKSAEAETDAFAGLWNVATSEADGLPGEPAVSFAGFRVVEVLAGGVAESTAVGRTAGVTGFFELAGNVVVSGSVEVEIATLRTDNSHRDSHMRQALSTKEFPVAVFDLVGPLELPAGVFEGEAFEGPVQGNLTIKGVTNRAVFDLKARLVSDTIVVVGSAEVVFGDYGVTAPKSGSVISVEEQGVMEFQLYFTR